MRLTLASAVLAVLALLAAGLVWNTSPLLGLSLLHAALMAAYFHLPMLLLLRGVALFPRPFPPWTLRFWLAVFAALNLPKGALIRLNNLVTGNMTVRREEAHILVARCLQRSQCSHPVTADISHCRECGRCKIGAVKAIARTLGVSGTVEGGGTSARQRLQSRKPRLVVAVACERELLAGIIDARLPVVGIAITPGPRPCADSDVSIAELRQPLKRIIEEV